MTERLRGITGCMFSGKTDELIRLVTREGIAGRKFQVFKPRIDTRWGKLDKIRSHSGAELDAVVVESSLEILKSLSPDTEIVAIDEAQFFDGQIVDVVAELLERDIEVVFAGLPLSFRGEDFGEMPHLLTRADEIVPLNAICTYTDDGEICGENATRTQRLVDGEPANYDDPLIVIGAEESYAARCPKHHLVPGRPERKLGK